ncbi:MAG: hypothetical protein V4726_21275 [Verrucomicrobiota bacterium]
MALSPKQTIYREILHWTLPHLRNVSTWRWAQRLRDRSSYYEAELVHNLPVSMYEPDFVEPDVWFLNVQAKAYYEQCSAQKSVLYPGQVGRIRELFALVPPQLRLKLQWLGPP